MPKDRPLKILHLVGDREDAGGVLSVIRNLDTASDSEEWRHVVWVNEAYQETRQPKLDYRQSVSVIAESSRHLDLLWQSFPACRELMDLCQNEHFDVIHAHSRGTLLVALLFTLRTKRPVIYTNHNYANGKRLYQWAAKCPQMHTVVLTQNMARHYGLKVDNETVHQISACFSDHYLDLPVAKRRTFNSSASPLRLIGVGSVIGWKKWDLMLEGIRRLPRELQHRIEFNIWGPTLQFPEAVQFAEKLKHTIDQNQLSSVVHLKGSTTEVVAKLSESDVFVLPSTNEPCSVALMEALSLGLPVVVSRSGGNIDLVKEGCGLHFTPDDPESLKNVLERLITDPPEFRRPEAIRETVLARTASQVFNQYRSLYHRLAPRSVHQG